MTAGKTRKGKNERQRRSFSEFVSCSSIILARDAIHGRDNSITLVRLYDCFFKDPDNDSTLFPPLCLCVEFARESVQQEKEFQEDSLIVKIALRNPAKEEVTIGEFPIEPLTKPWFFSRIVLVLTQYLGFKTIGNYYFVVYGRTKDSEFEEVGRRLAPVIHSKRQAPTDSD